MADFVNATRAAWDRSFTNQVALAIPLFAMLFEHRRIIFKGGLSTDIIVQKGTTEGLSQSYFMNEPLSGGRIDVLDRAIFYTKYMQHPVQYDGRDVVENKGGRLTAPINTIELVTDTSQDGFRRYLQSKFWGTAVTDTALERDFASVPQALTLDEKYGTLVRTYGSNVRDWWQGATADGTNSDLQTTAISPSLANIAVWATVCRRYIAKGLDGRGRPRNALVMFAPEGIYQDIRLQAEAKTGLIDPSVMKWKYGFNAINIYDVDIVESSWMTLNNHENTIAMLNPQSWQFRISPDRRFRMTKFVWQGEHAGGIDAYLARIMLAGTLTCKMPRSNMLLLSVA